jgi:hypothetical protein
MEKPNPPRLDHWHRLSPLLQVGLALRVWHVVSARRFLLHVDYWLIPSVAFIAAFRLSARYVPANHSVGLMTILALSFLAATLALMALVPIQRRLQ